MFENIANHDDVKGVARQLGLCQRAVIRNDSVVRPFVSAKKIAPCDIKTRASGEHEKIPPSTSHFQKPSGRNITTNFSKNALQSGQLRRATFKCLRKKRI